MMKWSAHGRGQVMTFSRCSVAIFSTLVCALACAPERAVAAPFTPGNLVVVRVGDGTGTLGTAAAPTFLLECTTTGTLVQTIPLPTAVSGSNHILTNAGNATSEGFLTLSSNGRYLLLGGYDAAVGT